jgi:transcriptional regulator with XRE-family HTH domain
MEDARVRFGKEVRRKRSKLGVSQEEFADMCGLDRTYVGGIERGERNVGLLNIDKIAKAFWRVAVRNISKHIKWTPISPLNYARAAPYRLPSVSIEI